MNGFVCGSGGVPVELPEAGDGSCCLGAWQDGPQGCTCWRPVYDLEQQEPRPGPSGVQPGMCADCAFRPGSPERSGDETYSGSGAELDRLVVSGERFFCHQGIRGRARWRHPSGAEVEGHPADYDPPVLEGVPFKADGSPADLCAGWAARRLKQMSREAKSS